MKKNYRKSVIVEIINSGTVRTQDELLKALSERGIRVTQATLSRDVKELGAYKAIDPKGGSFYKLQEHPHPAVSGSVLRIDISGQLCVVHCRPGFASALAALIDRSALQGVMGTVAGDDTILVILKENADKEKLRNILNSIF